MPVVLLHYPEKQKRWKVQLTGDRFVIGRSREAQICIPLGSVSKQHAVIERKGSSYRYRDLGSKNGLYLNGFRLDKGVLEDGDELRVGSVLLRFFAHDPPGPPAEAPPAAPGAEPSPPPVLEELPEPAFDGSATIAIPAEDLPRPVELVLPTVDEEDSAAPLAPRAKAPRSWRGRAARPPAATAPRRFSAGVLGVAVLIALGAGFTLGYLASLVDEPAPSPPTAAGGGAAPTSPVAPPAAATPDAAPHPLGRVDLSQPETARRLCVRLFLDFAERPPTTDELRRMSSLKPEKQWDAIRSLATVAVEPAPDKLETACERLLGRKPTAAEHEALKGLAQGDSSWYVFHVGMSAEYLRADRRRRRSERQLARSLHVDLTGKLPAVEEEKTLVAELEAARKKPGENPVPALARRLIDSGSAAQLAPPAGDPGTWLDEVYARLLLRSATADERSKSLAAIGASAQGWKAVLLELALRPEYLEY